MLAPTYVRAGQTPTPTIALGRAERRRAQGPRSGLPRPSFKGGRRAVCAMRDLAFAGYPQLTVWRAGR